MTTMQPESIRAADGDDAATQPAHGDTEAAMQPLCSDDDTQPPHDEDDALEPLRGYADAATQPAHSDNDAPTQSPRSDPESIHTHDDNDAPHSLHEQ